MPLSLEQKQQYLNYLNERNAAPRNSFRVRNERKTENGQVNWEQFSPIARPAFIQPFARNWKEAEQRLEALLRQRPERFEMLDRFLASNGVTFGKSPDQIAQANKFYCDNVAANEDATSIAPGWFLFALDYALFLGDVAIDMSKAHHKLTWIAIRTSFVKEGADFSFKMAVSIRNGHGLSADPDDCLIRCGNAMLVRPPQDLTAGGRLDDPYDAFNRFIRNRLDFAKLEAQRRDERNRKRRRARAAKLQQRAAK